MIDTQIIKSELKVLLYLIKNFKFNDVEMKNILKTIKKTDTQDIKDFWRFIKRTELDKDMHIHVTHNSG